MNIREDIHRGKILKVALRPSGVSLVFCFAFQVSSCAFLVDARGSGQPLTSVSSLIRFATQPRIPTQGLHHFCVALGCALSYVSQLGVHLFPGLVIRALVVCCFSESLSLWQVRCCLFDRIVVASRQVEVCAVAATCDVTRLSRTVESPLLNTTATRPKLSQHFRNTLLTFATRS